MKRKVIPALLLCLILFFTTACKSAGSTEEAQTSAAADATASPYANFKTAIMLPGIEGENAILKNRELMGATDPKKAAAGTIRADFADSIDANAVHGSDAPETAAVEIAFFFPESNIHSR